MTPLQCDSLSRTMHAVNFHAPICTHQLPTDFLDDSLVFIFAPTLPKAPSAPYTVLVTSLQRRTIHHNETTSMKRPLDWIALSSSHPLPSTLQVPLPGTCKKKETFLHCQTRITPDCSFSLFHFTASAALNAGRHPHSAH